MAEGKVNRRFFGALHKGYLSEVRHLVFNEGCSVNVQFKDSSFPIQIIAEKGYVDVMKFLLTLRPSVDVKNCHGQTALILAMKNPDIVQLLVAYGAKVHTADPQKRTPLHLACAQGSVRLVKELINAGGRIRAEDRWGRTPLHVALLNVSHNKEITENYVTVLRLLLRSGAPVNKSDHQSSTPLFLAATVGDNGLLASKILLQQGANPDQLSRHKLTPLMVGIMKGYVAVCQLFIYINCDVNRRNSVTGFSCLQIAVKKDFFEIAKLIVESGCKLHEENWLTQVYSFGPAEDSPIMLWLKKLKCNPLPLKQLSRSKIRQTHSCKLHKVLHKLHYPKPLKDFIALNNLIPDEVKEPVST